MLRFARPAAAILSAIVLWPALTFAQATKAGVVTTLEGNVTVTRVTLAPQPQPLKFKDDIFVNDKITTGDQSIARMLLGGRAVVTVRERSTLTITEVPGKATIALEAGKIAVAVAKEKMRPGDSIEVRTANAVAGVRGTVLVAEVSRATAQLPGGPAPAVVTTFSVLRGQVEAFQLNPATGLPVGLPLIVGTLQQFRLAGFTLGSVVNITPQQVQQIVQGLASRRPQHSGGSNDQAKENGTNAGISDANTFGDVGSGGGGGNVVPPIRVVVVVPLQPGGKKEGFATPLVVPPPVVPPPSCD